MKKKLSILVALAMAVTTMLPAGVFARTDNAVDSVKSVSSEEVQIAPAPNLSFDLKDSLLSTETTNGVAYAEFKLTSTNANFVFGTAAYASNKGTYSTALEAGKYLRVYDTANNVAVMEVKDASAGLPQGLYLDTKKLADKIMLVRAFAVDSTGAALTAPAGTVGTTLLSVANSSQPKLFKMPLNLTVKAVGDITVAVDGMSSALTSGTYTVAISSTGATKTIISGTTDFTDAVTLKEIIMEELNPGFFTGATRIKLQAPVDFKWSGTPVITTSGGLIVGGASATQDSNDAATYYVDFNVTTATTSQRGGLYLSGLILTAKNDATPYNDAVNVKISGTTANNQKSLTEESFSIGKYVDYTTKLTGGDVTLVGATLETNATTSLSDKNKTAKVTFEELAPNTWNGTRKTVFAMPAGVKIVGAKIKTSGFAGGNTTTERTFYANNPGGYNDFTSLTSGTTTTYGSISFDGNKMTTTNLKMKADGKAKLEMTFFISTEADFVGPVNLTVSGGGVVEQSAKIATIINPITITTTTTDLQVGYQNLATASISIAENAAGAIKKNAYVPVYGSSNTAYSVKQGRIVVYVGDTIDTFSIEKGVSVSIAEGGDLLIDSYKVEGGELIIDIKRESTKPSTIVINDLKVRLNRNIPEGYYPLNIAGSAVVQNDIDSFSGMTDVQKVGLFDGQDSNRFQVTDYVKVVTPGAGKDGKSTKQVIVTIGETDMSVGQDTMTMDVAAYINDNRTMLPVKYVALAIGIPEQNIIWDANRKTVTVIYGARTVQMTIGSNVLTVNGTPVQMDTKAVIKDGRTFIPVAWLATALDVPYAWDGDSKTVTFNPATAE